MRKVVLLCAMFIGFTGAARASELGIASYYQNPHYGGLIAAHKTLPFGTQGEGGQSRQRPQRDREDRRPRAVHSRPDHRCLAGRRKRAWFSPGGPGACQDRANLSSRQQAARDSSAGPAPVGDPRRSRSGRTRPDLGRLHPRHRHDLDDFHPCAGHHLKVGVVLAKHLRGGFVGIGLDDRIAANPVFRVFGAVRVHALGLAQGAPPSTMEALCAPIQFIHASIPFFCISGVEFRIIVSKAAGSAM